MMSKNHNINSKKQRVLPVKLKKAVAALLSLCIMLLTLPLNLIPALATVTNNGTGTETSGYYVLKEVTKGAQLSVQGNSYEYKSENHNFDTGLESVENMGGLF